MRNFILFLRRFSNLILFLILEIVCAIFIARTNTLQGNDIMSSANFMMASMYEQRDDVAYYFSLKRMNDSLLSENKKLRKQIMAYNEVDTLRDTTVAHAPVQTDSTIVVQYADYLYRSAKVINNSIGSVNNYITINRGEDDGIRKDMSVISGTGVVGRVVHTSAHFASAITILSKQQQVSAMLKDGTMSYVVWQGQKPDELVMKDVPKQIRVKVGDPVYTTEFSFFPPGIPIGTVERITIIESKNLRRLYLKPATDFRKLQYVYVVDDKYAKEKKELEAKSKEEE